MTGKEQTEVGDSEADGDLSEDTDEVGEESSRFRRLLDAWYSLDGRCKFKGLA